MSLATDLDNFIKANGDKVFIEAEARPTRLESFYAKYNSSYYPNVNDSTEGIIVLDENANKWGLELRLYLNHKPTCIASTRNTVYRSEYSYRVNDVATIWEMFALGYRIGIN